MWHSAAYTGSITNGLTNTALVAATDNVFRIGSSNGFVMQEDMMLLGGVAANNNGTAFRLNAPKFAQFAPIAILPLMGGPKTTSGLLVATWPYRPPIFRNQEEVTATVDTGGTAAAQETLIVSFSNKIDDVPPGEELTLKATSSTAAVANAWTLVSYTLSQTLPEGRYAIISSEVQSTNAVFHRWTFWGQFYRPGFPSTTLFSNPQYPGVYDFRKGKAGEFSNVTLPNLEVWCNGTDSSHTAFIRVIKTA